MTPERKHEVYLWGGVIGGAVILFVVFHPVGQQATVSKGPKGSPSRQPMSSHPSTMPNPAQASLDEAFLQARTTALGLYDQTALGELTANDQLSATNNETRAAQAIAFNQDSTQYKITGLQTSAQEQIAQEEVAAQEQAQQTQLQEVQSQQPQWWQYLLGGLGSIGSMFGFNLSPYLNPVSYGSATVPAGGDSSLINPSVDPIQTIDNTPLPTIQYSVPWNVIA